MKKIFLICLFPLIINASFFRDGIKFYKQKDYKNALKSFENAAIKENSRNAYFFLGELYLKGLGIKQDLDKAEKYLKKAYIIGNARAACLLAEVILLKYNENIKAKKLLIDGLKSGAKECKDIAKKYKINL